MKATLQRIAAACGLFAATLLAGCATAPSAAGVKPTGGSDAALIAAAQPAIAAANTDWPGAMRARDARTLAAPFAETGALITAGGKAITGRAAIESYYREAFEHSPPIIDGQIVDDGIASSGNLVYVWGHGNYTIERTPGQPSANSGYFLTVWQADEAGNWKVVRHLIF
ncbi:SgcJ/EcaC family oxidoreductase [Dokdonella sp.]|uniref:YybH family protein n=1 Tax=Dokdonella sp. TaxID=2291710 RepID=UPI001B21DC4C|nr:SgcJ/EcaC family oxidoreductase [Dokdonella sp.]MBO9662624.1 SgcJ/EcaC family oxidoreductase [Dokdonella sp.]